MGSDEGGGFRAAAGDDGSPFFKLGFRVRLVAGGAAAADDGSFRGAVEPGGNSDERGVVRFWEPELPERALVGACCSGEGTCNQARCGDHENQDSSRMQ